MYEVMELINGIFHAAFEALMDRKSYGLEESRHAPKMGGSQRSTPFKTSGEQKNPSLSFASTSLSHHPIDHTSPLSHVSDTERSTKMPPVANVDDTAGFMAAARAFKLNPASYTSPVTPIAQEDSNEQVETWKAPEESTGVLPDAADVISVSASNKMRSSRKFPLSSNAFELKLVPANIDTPSVADTTKQKTVGVSNDAVSFAADAGALRESAGEEGYREHLTTFETWGRPVARDKPAARVRTIIIKGLPSAWASPAKVLPFIYGGAIENISVSSSGTALIRFCDPDACQAFYDKYPNGIDLDKSRKLTVFVEMGKDVNVVSSQLSFNLSVGATRVVCAVGVDMDITMAQLAQLASSQNRKVEKILDYYVPDVPRTVTFRFCSIEDAVRFRAAIIRNIEWEQCNVQYTTDPCDAAAGVHVD
ncbi:hypothetical protein EYZ11_009127 [Aspergillus tanneri]|uniref:Uncharacterized protein n=1 Tax=Aspergillus tanneri TaxID=1220188 RepID=A0A4S3JAU6_9EURO|nr:uncharacterized protein ATNIH1004_002647 [Aspergillus tanneri]KAA8649967.1 hypothetical protein ATNIH1004_002647 [Aspergillus tanneri]THC91417.1 hypothetical protein EYZ11_009127 [Aspergillus tanneri]